MVKHGSSITMYGSFPVQSTSGEILTVPCVKFHKQVGGRHCYYNRRKQARLIKQYSLACFRLLFKLSLIRSSTTRGSGTSILSRWSLQKLLLLLQLVCCLCSTPTSHQRVTNTLRTSLPYSFFCSSGSEEVS